MLTARLSKGRFNRLQWDLDPERSIPIYWHEPSDGSFTAPFHFIDPEKDPPLTFHIVHQVGKWRLFIHHHHAISDGSGSFSFLHEIFLEYDRLVTGSNHPLPLLDNDRLERRNQYGLSFANKIALIPAQFAGLLIATTLFRRDVSELIESVQEPKSFEPLVGPPQYISKQFDTNTYKALKGFARERKASVNDLMLAYLHAAIGKWRDKLQAGCPSDWIRISVPLNLRAKSDKSLSACNVISIVSIDRQAKGLRKKARLIRRAKEDMQLIKKGNLGLIFLIVLWIQKRLAGGIRKFCHRSKCRTSIVFTNIGQLYAHSPLRNPDRTLSIGGSIFERFTTIAPFRPHSQATIQTHVYAGKLTITLHYDSRALPRDKAESLFEIFENELLGAL